MSKFCIFILSILAIVFFSGCATIVNDANIPLAVSFSDGSSGKCDFRNKRGTWSSQIPTNSVMIRRSDDALGYNCTTEDGRTAAGSVKSEIEGGKLAASVVFFDLGITDAITDKHRTYQGNIVIPMVEAKQTLIQSKSELVQQCIDACAKASSKSPEACFNVCAS